MTKLKITKTIKIALVACLLNALSPAESRAVIGKGTSLPSVVTVLSILGIPAGIVAMPVGLSLSSSSDANFIYLSLGGLALTIASIVVLDQDSYTVAFQDLNDQQAERFELSRQEQLAFNEDLPLINGIIEFLSNSYFGNSIEKDSTTETINLKDDWIRLTNETLNPLTNSAILKITSNLK